MYRNINSRMWDDPTIAELTPQARLLFIWLFSNNLSHLSGLYYVVDEMASKQTGLKMPEVRKAFVGLEASGLVKRDGDLVWIVNQFRYQARGEKAEISAAKHIQTLHPSRLISEFIGKYPAVAKRLPDTLSIPHRYPIDTQPIGETGPLGERVMSTFEGESGESQDAPRKTGLSNKNNGSLIPHRYPMDTPSIGDPLRRQNQKTESESEEESGTGTESVRTYSSTGPVVSELVTDQATPDAVVSLWRERCVSVGFPDVRKMTPKLRSHLNARCRDLPKLEQWEALLDRVAASEFLRTGGDGTWGGANLRWLVESVDKFEKTLEGAYDDKREGFLPPEAWAQMKQWAKEETRRNREKS